MTSACAWFNVALRPQKPQVSLGRGAQYGHLEFHTPPEPCVPAPLRVNFVGAGPELCVPAPPRVDLVGAGDSQCSGSPSKHSLNRYLFQSDNPKHVPISSASSFFTLQTDNRLFHPLVHSDRN